MESKDVFEYRLFCVVQKHAGMKVGTDADLLGTLSAGGKRILDIGTGTGVLSLMLAQRFPEAEITAVEIDDNAILDAKVNFQASPFADRITLVHASFQDFLADKKARGEVGEYDCIVCNPPYFDKSLENPDKSRMRARHTSSLPFRVLIEGAFDLLAPGGVFSVCIPPEVLSDFKSECIIDGFWLEDEYRIKSIPEKPAKRFVLVHRKGRVMQTRVHEHCMRNSDKSRSEWYVELMREFFANKNEE